MSSNFCYPLDAMVTYRPPPRRRQRYFIICQRQPLRSSLSWQAFSLGLPLPFKAPLQEGLQGDCAPFAVPDRNEETAGCKPDRRAPDGTHCENYVDITESKIDIVGGVNYGVPKGNTSRRASTPAAARMEAHRPHRLSSLTRECKTLIVRSECGRIADFTAAKQSS